MGDNGAKALGVKLFKDTRLSILSLAHNRIGDAGVAVLAKGIATVPSLMVLLVPQLLATLLRVVDCSCRPPRRVQSAPPSPSHGARLIMTTALEHCQSRPSLAVQEFSLAFNRCASSGATSLASALRSRGTALRRAPTAGAAHSARQLALESTGLTGRSVR